LEEEYLMFLETREGGGNWAFVYFTDVPVMDRMASSADIYRELLRAKTKLGRCYLWN
jgi:hypothetical protein